MTDVIITFNSLYNLLRGEKKSKALQDIPENFYDAVNNYLRQKEKEIEDLKGKKDREKLLKERKIYNNSRKIVDELMDVRCMKISEVAIKNSLKDKNIIDDSKIIEKPEKDYYKSIKEEMRKLKSGVLKNE